MKPAMVSPYWVKEVMSAELLYSPLALAYLARHTPNHCHATLYDECVGPEMDANAVDADLVAVSAITPGISRAYEIGDCLRKEGSRLSSAVPMFQRCPKKHWSISIMYVLAKGRTPGGSFLETLKPGTLKRPNGNKDLEYKACGECRIADSIPE